MNEWVARAQEEKLIKRRKHEELMQQKREEIRQVYIYDFSIISSEKVSLRDSVKAFPLCPAPNFTERSGTPLPTLQKNVERYKLN